MPIDSTDNFIRVRQHEPGRYGQFRNTPLSEEDGIFVVEGKVKDTDKWEVQTLLFAKSKDWTIEKAKAWIADHDQFSWPGTQAEQDSVTTQAELVFVDEVTLAEDTIDIPAEDLSKYIEVRQHPKGHFTSYQHQWLNKAQGIIKSIGKWKKTGATVVQKLLFRRDKGWTEETVKVWFSENPKYHYPEAVQSGLFFALADDRLNDVLNLAVTAEVIPIESDDTTTVFDVILLRSGWGKNKRRGSDGRVYQDYMSDEFLQSLIPLVEGSAVQSVRVRPKEEVTDERIPDLIKNTVAELKQYGHPPELVNMLLSQGLEGNTIGFLKNCHLELHTGMVLGEETIDGTVVRAEFHLADTDDAKRSRQLWQTAWRQGLSKSLGLSINYNRWA